MSKFTKQHYVTVAKILSVQEPFTDGENDLIYEIMQDFIEVFEMDNPNFDKIKFIEACYDSK